MPAHYITTLTAQKRSDQSNLHLGVVLCAIAGGLNAGGFLAVGRYTSHMTGLISSAADDLVLNRFLPALAALSMVLAFIFGAACSAMIINYAKRNAFEFIYTPVLLLEAILLLAFGLLGSGLLQHELISISLSAFLLCYVMGLQNALITKISHAEIRTTHVTGLVTDIGIELGKMIYWNRLETEIENKGEAKRVVVNQQKLRLHVYLVLAFCAGAIGGAASFKYVGFSTTIPLALGLIVLVVVPTFHAKNTLGH